MKFYEFEQNNSGGTYVIDDKVNHIVFIEAASNVNADSIAEDLGVYFNGCDDKIDCYCCGDRWSSGEELKFPIKFHKDLKFNNVIEYAQYLANEYSWNSYIYYNNGDKIEINKEENV
jgi:cytochrome c oxidase assembly protein Cox11